MRGRSHWLWQRLSAVGLAAAVAVIALNWREFATYEGARGWLVSLLGAGTAMVLVAALFSHAHLGVSNVVEDYVRSPSWKKFLLRASFVYAVAGSALGVFALLKLWALSP